MCALLLGDLADDFVSGDVQRGVEARGPVPLVVVRSPFDLARPQGQYRLRSIKRLELGLLVDGYNEGVVRRTHVEADDIDDLLGESRVTASFEGPQRVQLKALTGPNLRDLLLRDSHRLRHETLAPLRGARRIFLDRLGQTLHDFLKVKFSRAARTWALVEPLKVLLVEAPDQLVDVARAIAEGGGDDAAGRPSCAARMMRARVPVFERGPIASGSQYPRESG